MLYTPSYRLRWSTVVYRPAVLLPFALTSFAANSLATRYVVGARLIDLSLFGAIRFVAGALTLVWIAFLRRDKVVVSRSNLRPAILLGVYALGLSHGYQYIGAAAGTFVFYTVVLVTLVAHDLATNVPVPVRRGCGAAMSLAGIGVLTLGSVGQVSVPGIVLLAAAGTAWGLYTAMGRRVVDARSATTGHFVVVALIAAPSGAVGVAAGLRVTFDGVVWAVVVGAGTTAIAYVAWFICQRSMSGTSAATAQLIVPLITAAGAVVFLDEQPSLSMVVAAACLGVGTWLARPRSDDAADPVDRPNGLA